MAEEFANWQAPDHDNEVSYSIAAMESMRREAVVGLQKIPKRGLEIGGILFGTHDGARVEIHQWREIECDHSHGPGFELSESDEARLGQFLAAAANDPTLGEFEAVGWFRSRTRGALFLSDADVAIFDRFFPEPWQVSLVIRPYTYEPAQVGFFIREASGDIQRESSLNPFELENRRKRITLGFDPSQALRRPVEEESNAWSGHTTPRSEVPPLPPDALPPPSPPSLTPAGSAGPEAPELVRRPPRPATDHPVPVRYGDTPRTKEPRSKAKLALLGLSAFLVILIGVILGVPALSEPSSGDIDLHVRDVGGQLILEWDPHGASVQAATGASLSITDGRETHEVQLTPDELRGGTVVYERQTGNVELGLTLQGVGTLPVSEFTHFVGTDPIPGSNAPMRDELNRAMQEERDLLRERFETGASQLEALQTAVDEEKARIGK
jgi:hypothetical protein